MAPRTVYANLQDGQQPLSLWDNSLADMGKLGIIPCTAVGVNSIVLTPIPGAFAPTVATPNQLESFAFVAAGASTGPVTVQIGTAAALKLYRSDGVTQITTGDLATGIVYTITYNSALNSSAGGYQVAAPAVGSVQSVVNDTNVTGSVAGTTLTLGWAGTLAAARLNSSVVQAVTNDTNITGSISAQNLTFTWSGTLAASRGGFGADVSAQSGVPLFATGVPTFTGTTGSGNFVRATSPTLVTPALGTPASGVLTNCTGLPLSGLTTQAAWSFVVNNTSGAAVPTAVDIPSFTLKASPAASDLVVISDQAASGALKRATVSSLAASAGVSSIAGNTGAFTLSHGITNSTNDIQIDIATQQGALFGLTLSTAGASSTFGIAAGFAVDVAATDFMKLTSAYTKTTSAWAVGTGNGSLDTGSIANSTWYHVYLIKRPDTGVVDVLISLSASAPTMPTNYTLKRRIGAMKTNGSAQWNKFVQLADEFLWDAPTLDVSGAAIGTSALTPTLTVPTNVQVWALVSANVTNGSSTVDLLLNSPDVASIAAGAGSATLRSQSGQNNSVMPFGIRTNTSAQIRAITNAASSSYTITTFGWIDTRGRYA